MSNYRVRGEETFMTSTRDLGWGLLFRALMCCSVTSESVVELSPMSGLNSLCFRSSEALALSAGFFASIIFIASMTGES